MINVKKIITSIDKLNNNVDIPGLIRKQYHDKLISQLIDSEFNDLSETLNKEYIEFEGLPTPEETKSGKLYQYNFVVLLVTDSHVFLCMYYDYHQTKNKIYFSRKYLIDKYITERISGDIDYIRRCDSMNIYLKLE